MDLLSATGIEKAWGGRLVLRGVDLTVMPGDRLGLVGPNGCGKSTLLAILAGTVEPDHGTVRRRASAGVLEQDPVLPGATVGEAADAALAWHRALLDDYEHVVGTDPKRAMELQDRLDQHGWDLTHKVDAVLDRLRAPPRSATVPTLSGGERRRVALARALLASPDLLLLDEPTNHLDSDAVEWLEDHLAGFRGGVVLVTHDRYLLERVATRIVEIDQGVGVSYEGSYGDYLVERAERQSRLVKERDSKLNLLAREAAWAAKSPAARSTKQKARLDRLEALKDSIPQAREQKFDLDLRTGDKLGRILMEGRGLVRRLGGRTLIDGLDFDLMRGERIGVVGPNGAGKTTLLRLVQGLDAPDRGKIDRAPRVRVAVLDQDRSGLDPEQTVAEAAAGGNTHLVVGDDEVHVASFLGRFLFAREQIDQKVAGLSGGERARLLLAKLLLQGANVLLLDEPTNDLDLMTLRVLEEALLSFDGAAIVVTHDRAFLDRVCTGLLAFEGDGRVVRYASRLQWQAARRAAGQKVASTPAPAPVRERKPQDRLSFKENQELGELPAHIERLEQAQRDLEAVLADPATYRTRAAEVPVLSARLAAIPGEVEALYARWEALEARR